MDPRVFAVPVAAVVVVAVALQHPNRRFVLTMAVVVRRAVDHHGNCLADLMARSHHIVAKVANHDDMAVVDNYDFPADFESNKSNELNKLSKNKMFAMHNHYLIVVHWPVMVWWTIV